MSATFQQFVRELDDPRLYVRVPDRAIFDAHVEKNKKGKVVRKFEKADLERIARNCNQRDQTGTLCPITIGHTDPDEPDETKQPELVGYARKFRVAYDQALGKWTLRADYYIRKDAFGEAKTFPRTSVELWPEDEILDPVALLRRTPQRDLGQWIYSRTGKTVLRYSMESANMNDDELDMGGEPAGGAPDNYGADETPGMGGEAEPSHEEMCEQFARHCMSHPHAKKLAEHFAMEDKPEEPAEDLGEFPVGDPTDTPSAEEEPELHAAFPSGTNGALPGGKKPAAQFRKNQEAVRYSQLQKKMAALEHDAATSKAEAIVTQLTAEGYDLDAGVEVPRLARMNEKQRAAAANHIRRYYRQAPVAQYGRVPVMGSTSEPETIDNMSERRLDQCLQYQRKHKCSFEEAATKAPRK